MALGITFPLGTAPLAGQRELLRKVVDLGYTDLWTMETSGLDAMTPLALAAAWAPELRLGSAIASVFTRGPALLAMQAASLAEAAPGRFVLGLGSSSRPIVEGWNGVPFERPLARVRDTVRFLRLALGGERVTGPFETLSTRGFRLERAPAEVPPIWIGGLRAPMLRLAGHEADGALLSLATPADVPSLAGIVRAERPDTPIGMRVGVLAGSDVEASKARARAMIAAYLNVDGYAEMHRGLGRAEELEAMWHAWSAGDRKSAAEAVPASLVEGLFAIGSPEACAETLLRFRESGVDTVIASLMTDGPEAERALVAIASRLA